MSVFGGDSWAREAHNRKRRIHDLISQTIDSSAFKKLSNGQFTCIVCPHNPTIHTPLMLSAHMKGSRHLAAAAKLRERALSDNCSVKSRTGICSREKKTTQQPPLIAKTRQLASEVIVHKSSESSVANERHMQSCIGSSLDSSSLMDQGTSSVSVVSREYFQNLPNSRELREKELKFTAAGWKRDGCGRWFKDQNAEFDSDEEDPNEYFAH